MAPLTLSAEAKANMIANLELELNARKEKLQAMCEAQVASLRSRLERRVNRIPNNKRQMLLVDLLDSSLPSKPAPAKKEVGPAKKEPAPVARKTRAAPATNAPKAAPAKTASKSAAPKDVAKPAAKDAVKPAATRAAPKSTATTTTSSTTATTSTQAKTTRGKKRASDEMSGEDKENATELAIPKKRTRAAPQKPAVPSKATTATRSTRAASRNKGPAPSQVLSPKTTNNARPAPAGRTRRAR